MGYRERQGAKIVLKIVFIGLFLWISYNYFLKNSVDIIFTRLIQLPIISQVVESWVYWLIVLVVCFLIWKITNKIEIDVTKKNHLISIGVIALIGIAWAYNSGGINISTQNTNGNECPEGIVPDRIELTENLNKFYTEILYGELQIVEGSHAIGSSYNNSKTNWADGQIIELYCYRRYLEGENVNLVYCKNLGYSKTTTPVSKDGVVGKTKSISYSVNLTLEKESVKILKIPQLYRLPSNPLQKYDIQDYPITTYKIISSECKIA